MAKSPPQETLVVDPKFEGHQKRCHLSARRVARPRIGGAEKRCRSCSIKRSACFSTHVVGVTVGETLNIKNSDTTGHNTNIVGTGFNPTVPGDGSVPYPVQKEVSVPHEVKCSIHPWMTAYMLQRKNGYFAVTDAEGNFEIANVPAGEPLEFQVWHESGTAAGNGLVGTTPDATDVKWTNRGRIMLTLQPDEVKEIKVVVPPKAFRG